MCSSAIFAALTQRHSRFATRLLPCRNACYTLFEVGQEIRCSDVSSRCCCYGNHTAGSKPV